MELDKSQLFMQMYDDFADAVFRHCYFRLSDRDKAKEIKTLIENAGVSSFYLGKKGLAYVTNIDTREDNANG